MYSIPLRKKAVSVAHGKDLSVLFQYIFTLRSASTLLTLPEPEKVKPVFPRGDTFAIRI
jgi:hypothetical protein